MSKKERGETIWTSLDRKATAIAEFTMRQYRTRLSTWVVLGVGFLAISGRSSLLHRCHEHRN